ncbi:obscurin-like protein 1 isoform X2 [Erinaceus europaeus]|uniref:Obscurin-like protein 1 isoform X2 n=1 Tax=Erinaceus europaeus TaxID=9365 RepID=A0ABM3XLC8_ERIEU|nr:obscurin-like protein 1 isoform X2 [Erinaceus europaeus]
MKAGPGVQGSAPCFLRFPRPVRVPSGAEAELRCVVLGEPPPTVAWEKGGRPLQASERLSFPRDGAEHGLLLSPALPGDAGVYVCRARNAAGEAYAAAALTVLEPPAPPPSERPPPPPAGAQDPGAPTFVSGPRSQWVLRGAEVVLSCEAAGLPEPALRWEKDGMALDEVWDSGHFALEPRRAQGARGARLTLRIPAARLPDSGVYVCHARNAHGHAQVGALLQVHLPPDGPPDDPDGAAEQRPQPEPGRGAPKTFWVNEGKHAKFRCYVMGKPEPEIEWHWQGRPLLPDRRRLMYRDRDGGFVLKVLYCQARDRGLYVCAARNSAGQTLSAVQLHVKEPRLRFSRPLQDVEGREQGIAVLECRVPNARIPTAWFREDQRLLPCRKYEQIEEGAVRRLVIHRLRADDDGVYLCEMRGRVRSVATVTVRGPIVRRLPRKLDVLEGENAVLLVETREAGAQGRWSRDGEDLPAMCQSSSGHMHALVLPGVTCEDAGEVTFSLGSSRTTTLLRVKGIKHSPPGPPVLAEMFKGHKNTVLLTWKPPEPPPETPYIYRLERQEVGSEDWVQCFSIEKAGAVEVPGDCVPAEGDYRFRVCTVTQHGRSPHVLFHGAAHLVPTARLVAGLEDVQVYDGEDAVFSLDLSTIIPGTWFLNGEELSGGQAEGQVEPGALRYRMEHKGLRHRLILRAVGHRDSGTLVGFSCPGVQDSAALTIQESPVHILKPQERVCLSFTTSERAVLTCELSRADFPARWYKDGRPVQESEALAVSVDGRRHRLVLPKAALDDSGEFECRTEGVSAFFSVTVRDPPVHILDPREHVFVHAITSECVVLSCQLSREDAPVRWYKDGLEVEAGGALVLESEGPHRRLVLPAAQPPDGGEFQCEAGEERAYFTVTITDVSSWIVYPSGKVFVAAVRLERVVLTCELCRPWAEVRWTKDGVDVVQSEALLLQQEDAVRRLVLPAVQLEDSGEYLCQIDREAASFTLTVTEPPVHILHPQDEVTLLAESGERVVLSCQLSREDAPVCWYKDGLEVEEGGALVLESEGPHRRLVLPAAQPPDGGEFVCDAGDDSAFFTVTVTAPPEKIVCPATRSLDLQFQTQEHVELCCEVAPTGSRVRWLKDGLEVDASAALLLGAEGAVRTLTLPCARPEDAGEYVCETRHDAVTFNVSLAEALPTKLLSELTPLTVQEGEDATFRCEVSPPHAEVTWLLRGDPVTPGPLLQVAKSGSSRTLTLRGCRPADAGTVTAQAGDTATTARLHVREKELLFLRKLQDVCTEEGQEVCLEAETDHVGAAGSVCWVRGQEPLPSDQRLAVTQEGCLHRLCIHGVLLADQGTYGCESSHDRTLARLSVRPRQLKVLQPLEDVMAEEGGSATFQLELSQEGVAGEWALGGVLLQPGPKCHMQAEGQTYRLVLHGLGLAEAGCVAFTADSLRCAARLTVREAPVTFVRGPQDLEVTEGDTATFECELSQALADVTWEKDGHPLSPGERVRLQALGTRRLLQLRRCGLSDAGTYDCAAGAARCGPASLAVRGRRHVLVLSELRPEDAGEVRFQAGRAQSVALLEVEALPLQMCRRPPREKSVLAGRRAVLEVTVSRAGGRVRWLREGAELREGGRYELRSHGPTHSLVIRDVRPEDQGTYCCQADGDSAHTRLLVEGS